MFTAAAVQANAAPLSSVMNSRRLRLSMGSLRNPLGQLIASQVAAEAARRSLG
jgi:hypothetical protein